MYSKCIVLFACVWQFATTNISAQKIVKTTQWEMLTLSMTANKKVKTPFQATLECTFTAPDGNVMTIPGFYNGNNEWLIRFNPNKEGTWTGVSSSSIKKFNAQKYTVQVTAAKPKNKGGLKVSTKDIQKLTYENGDPYNLLAFEADWLFALDYGSTALPKTTKLVETIKENGFNQVVMNVYAHDVKWKQSKDIDSKYNFGGIKEIFPFLGTNDKPDYSALNIDFFKHFDKVIELLDANDIVSHLMIYVWNKKVNWPEANSAADNMYFDYVVKRYQAYNNLLWDISKEALGYGHDDPEYITERIKRLRKLDGHQRLVTVHDYEYCEANPDEVDIVSVQFWYTDVYSEMIQMKKDFPNKPILNIEHGGYEKCQYEIFEGNYDDAITCVERNYKCAFAGTYSTYYWQGTSWNVVFYDPFAADVTLQPKFEYYKHMRSFLDKINFEKLTPSKKYSASGYCMANLEDDEFVYYMPKDNSAMAIRRLPKSEKLLLQWFNPLTGAYSEPKEIDYYKGWLMLYPEYKGIDNIVMVKLIGREEEN